MRTRTAFGPRPNSASGSLETSRGDGDIKLSLKMKGYPLVIGHGYGNFHIYRAFMVIDLITIKNEGTLWLFDMPDMAVAYLHM